MMLELGRLLCRMRLHRWHEVKVITGLDLQGVTMTREQLDELKQRWPAPEPPAFAMPWEAGMNALLGVPVWIGGEAQLHVKPTRTRTETQCRRCAAPRPTRPVWRDVGMHRVRVGREPKTSMRPPAPPPNR